MVITCRTSQPANQLTQDLAATGEVPAVPVGEPLQTSPSALIVIARLLIAPPGPLSLSLFLKCLGSLRG
jgi:hypothetical protein